MHNKRNILIVGVGNTLMGDDGIGAYVASRIEEQQLPGVHAIHVQQMTSDLLDELLKADHTIIVDAAVQGDPVQFYKVDESAPAGASYSHYTSAIQLLKMAELVYERQLSIHICAVGAWDLTLGGALSQRGKKNADQAVSTILGWINGHENQ
ncbi:MAG TPA: hydrogenase maturation protease [Chitinophagaceae bacterium]|nr:hydrogenase maturation protease [Chitinophagaceae bacterium]HPH31861.1 hydrogenase maturation protease [Chitinophagaceae bacterium]